MDMIDPFKEFILFESYLPFLFMVGLPCIRPLISREVAEHTYENLSFLNLHIIYIEIDVVLSKDGLNS